MQAAVSKAISKEEQEFLPAYQPQLFPFTTVDVTFHRLEQDVQIKLGVAAGAAAVVGWEAGGRRQHWLKEETGELFPLNAS